jgi:putative flippase GtrA
MHALLERVRAFRRSPHFKRTLKFASVSVVTTIVAQTVLFVTLNIIKIHSAVACSIIATSIATIPAYWLNRTWTWGKKGKSSFWTEVLPFWVIAFIGLVLSTSAVALAAHNADHLTHSHHVRNLLIQAAYFFSYALIWLGRYTIFNKYMFGETTQRKPVIETVPVEVETMTSTSVEATTR